MSYFNRQWDFGLVVNGKKIEKWYGFFIGKNALKVLEVW
jgi:hypothetical protein